MGTRVDELVKIREYIMQLIRDMADDQEIEKALDALVACAIIIGHGNNEQDS